MARTIKKVIKFTQAHYIVYNVAEKQVENKIELFAGIFKAESSVKKAIKKNLDMNTYRLIDLVSTDVILQKREITMDNFIKYSTECEVVVNEEN